MEDKKSQHEDITELKLDHPGATDPLYRARRDFIASHKGPIEYLGEENKTWQIATTKLDELHRKLAHTSYLRGKKSVGLPQDHIPQLHEVSARLKHTTIVPVSGLIDAKTFLSRLGRSHACS